MVMIEGGYIELLTVASAVNHPISKHKLMYIRANRQFLVRHNSEFHHKIVQASGLCLNWNIHEVIHKPVKFVARGEQRVEGSVGLIVGSPPDK